MRRALWLALAAAASALVPWPAAASHLEPGGVTVLDMAGTPRARFSSTEKAVFVQKVQNLETSSGQIQFTFRVKNPSGREVFTHTGNSAPAGSVGEASTRLAGIPISRFYSTPGVYTVTAEAVLGAETPVVQQATFEVTSPLITLLYPPDGARGLADRPLILHWVGSGSSKFRVLVDDDASFYNVLFSRQTAGPESTFVYPENPSDSRQRLAAGQVYYWKVEGLDAFGNVVAQTGVPNSFSLRGQEGSLVRDAAVTGLDVAPPAPGQPPGAIPFRVTVRNQGGTSENSLQLRFTVGGIAPPNTPLRIPLLAPGEQRDYVVPARVPADQTDSLVVACLDLFDDNVPNNCRTLFIRGHRPPTEEGLAGAATGQALAGDLTADTTSEADAEGDEAAKSRERGADAWNSIRSQAPAEVAEALRGYNVDSIAAEGMSAEEARDLLQALKQGKAKVLEMVLE